MGGKICLSVVQMLETQSGPKWRASKYIHGGFLFSSSIDPAHDGPAITGNKEIILIVKQMQNFHSLYSLHSMHWLLRTSDDVIGMRIPPSTYIHTAQQTTL